MGIRILQSSSLAIAAASFAFSGYASAQASPNSQVATASATLVQNIDSKNASQGEAVTARLTSNLKGATELPKGTVLVGTVAQVQPSTNGSQASLSIVFDQAQLRDGHKIPIKATIIGAFPEESSDFGPSPDLVPDTIAPDQQVDQEPGPLSHVSLHSAVQSNTSGVFSSTDRNINLKKGTQLQFAISEQGSTATGE